MPCLEIQMVMFMIATWFQIIGAYKINTTIHDTNLAHITYSDAPIECNRWTTSWLFWQVCDSWLMPWKTGVYHSQGKMATYHSSLNHQLASVAIEFKGTDVWVYGPPASHLAEPPPNYKICLLEKTYHTSSKDECYQVHTKKAYFATDNDDEPVVVFARGQLPDHQHRIVISVADPVDDHKLYSGIKLSHVVYTTERPTPWPAKEDGWRYREVVMHDTHPLLSYNPPVSSNRLTGEPVWLAKVHTAEDGAVMSWHELWAHNESDQSQWRVDTKIKAGALAIYGAPSAYIETRDNLGFVCVRLGLGLCETVDLKTIYANQGHHEQHEPVLLWFNNALDPSHETHISIRLVQVPHAAPTVFPFKSINYFEEKEHPSLGSLAVVPENVTINHDDQVIGYNPGRRGISQWWHIFRSPWFDPWMHRGVGPSGSVLTYRSTLAQYRINEDPHVFLNFSATAVYLYGAPSAHAKRPFAPQHVCIDNMCRLIDIEQAYLYPRRGSVDSAGIGTPQSEDTANIVAIAPLSIPHPELEPVLIWSITDLDDRVEHTLRLALAPLPSPDHSEMTFVKVVYTRVNYSYGDRLDLPPPEPEHAYMGPSHPLYATKWEPLGHTSPPPSSINPPPNQSLYLLLSLFVLLEAYRFLHPTLSFWLSRTRAVPLGPNPIPSSSLQPTLSQVYPEPSPLRSFNGYNTQPSNPSNTTPDPTWTSQRYLPGSPPLGYSNATDTPYYSSSAAASDTNGRR